MPFSSTSTRRPLFTKDGAITVGEDVIGSSLHSRRNRSSFVGKNPTSTKAYICAFTYACSRLTHLNLTSDLSTNKFFQALIRMISGRWLCSTIWSDNAKTFKSADREIQQLFTQESSANRRLWDKIDQEELQAKLTSRGIKWRFIVERSPWRGGWWERLLRSVKEPLRKVLGKALLSF